MDVTLTPNQEKALKKFIDATVGDEPSFLDHSLAARNRRVARMAAADWLHRFAALCMRVGADRARANLGLSHNPRSMPVWVDPKTGGEELKRPIPDGQDRVVYK